MLASESLPIHFKEALFKQYNTSASSPSSSPTNGQQSSSSSSTSSPNSATSSPASSPLPAALSLNEKNDLALKSKIMPHSNMSPISTNSNSNANTNTNGNVNMNAIVGTEDKTTMAPSILKDNIVVEVKKPVMVGVGSSAANIYPSVDFEQSCKMFNNNNNINSSHSTNEILINSGHGQCQERSLAFIASHPDAEYEKFIRECVDIIIEKAVFSGTNRSSKVVEWHDPSELKELLDLKVRENGEPCDNLLDLIRKTIQYSVKTGHPYFINQLYSGVDPYALIGQWLTDSLNPSVYTFEVAPVFTLMEEEVLHEMRKIVGFPDDGFGDGIFCPGGSIANGYAISCARYHKAPETKQLGLFSGKRMIVFTSEDAHYSVQKLATYMGFGSDNVWKIPTDNIGKMSLEHLEKQIQKALEQGFVPLMVSATAGTTVLGAFDPLEGIAELCQKYKMWCHVDAAWGGGALMSPKYRSLLKGIEKADSVTWNPHKLLTASQQCSTFLTRHKEILSQCHSTNATYLFQKDKFYDTSYDTGDKHIQCGRRADVFKFWFMWKAKGTKGFEAHVDQLFKMSEYFADKVKSRPGFELVLEKPECTNISFWYIPPSLRNLPRDETFNAKLHAVAPKIKESMIKKGSMMITYQPLGKLPNFFRLVLQNSTLNEADMIYFLNEIETLGCKL